jgi:predicted ATPase/DNA-binding CsgD family transcriptional regulator
MTTRSRRGTKPDLDPWPGPDRAAHNIATPLTRLIGREHALAHVRAQLGGTRLLTLTGAGGCGKTRLALEVARTMVDRYPGGVWVVELAALADAALIPQLVADALHTREAAPRGMRSEEWRLGASISAHPRRNPHSSLPEAQPSLNQPTVASLVATLRTRSCLLVLDNCEHLLDGCAQLMDLLLSSCPELNVLATSREPLGLTGEIAWRVPSLPVPDPTRLAPVAELLQSPAVELFLERVRAVSPTFRLDDENARSVALVCHQLDGIPLALELAAPWVELLTPDQLTARLDRRFQLLIGGSRAALPRQQTLRATLDWSNDLLTDPEQRLLYRLSVFAGGWTLEAAEDVTTDDAIRRPDMIELLRALVRKSLVVAEADGSGGIRYRLLETLRQYAAQKLMATDEAEAIHRRHACFFLALAEQADPSMWEDAWLTRLLADHDNLRAALRWLSRFDALKAVRLGGRLWPMWVRGGFVAEGRAQLQMLMALCGPSQKSAEWAALTASAALVEFFAGDYHAAHALLQKTNGLYRDLGDQHGLAISLTYLGHAARDQGRHQEARALLEESLGLSRALGNHRLSCKTLDSLGTVAQALGDYEAARIQYEQSLELSRHVANRIEEAWAIHNLGCLALEQGDYPTARRRLTQSLAMRGEDDWVGLVHALAEFSALAAAEGLPASAILLAGATAGLYQSSGIAVQQSERGRFEHWLQAARTAVGESRADAMWDEGCRMTLARAKACALAPGDYTPRGPHTTKQAQPSVATGRLTPRQLEVARLVGVGLSNHQIAEQLIITDRAAAAHIERILDRLGFRSRSQIAVWASEQGLLAAVPSDLR